MSLLKIYTVNKADFKKTGFNPHLTINFFQKTPSFYTEYIKGVPSVSYFALEILSISDARSGNISIIKSENISNALLKTKISNDYFLLYYDGEASVIDNKLCRFKFTDNANNYYSEPFFIKQ